MIREHIKVSVDFDSEADVWNVSMSVMGVSVWLACFDSRESAMEFISIMFKELNSRARYVTSYEIVGD
jgi:hypothetical protein